MATAAKTWPGHSDVGHPEIFNTMPLHRTPLKPGQLSEAQLKQFFEEVIALLMGL